MKLLCAKALQMWYSRGFRMIFGQLRMIMTMVIVVHSVQEELSAWNKLRPDNAILKANQLKLEASVESQKQVIAKQKEDFQAIMKANKELGVLKIKQSQERFTRLRQTIYKKEERHWQISN